MVTNTAFALSIVPTAKASTKMKATLIASLVLILSFAFTDVCSSSASITKPLNDIKKCTQSFDSKTAISSTALFVERSQTFAVGLVSSVSVLAPAIATLSPPLAAAFAFLQNVISLFPEKDAIDYDKCISNQVQKLMNDKQFHDGLNRHLARDKVFNSIKRKVMKTKPRKSQTSALKTVWNRLQSLTDRMIEDAGLLRGGTHEYNAGMYYVMPLTSMIHIQAIEVQLGLALLLAKLEQKENVHWKEEYTNKKGNLGKIMKYYSEISFRYWRVARDNWCQHQASQTMETVECKSQPAPFK